MKIDSLKNYITPKTTGYSALIGLGLTTATGISRNKSLKKVHKPLAWITAVLTLAHVGLIEYYNFKYKQKH